MEEWKKKLLDKPPTWAKQYSQEEFEDIVLNELIQDGFAHASLGGRASALAKRDRNEPIGFAALDKKTLIENCIKAGKFSKNVKSIWWFNGYEYKFVKECPGENWEISTAPNNVGKTTSNTMWWNDGTKHKRSKECPGEGWYLGRINNGTLGGYRTKGQR